MQQKRGGGALLAEGPLWQPDGWGWRARIRVLTPHLDIESEFQAMAPEGVSIHTARVPFGVTAAGGGTAAKNQTQPGDLKFIVLPATPTVTKRMLV